MISRIKSTGLFFSSMEKYLNGFQTLIYSSIFMLLHRGWQTKASQLSVFVNRALMEHSLAICLHIVYGCFHTAMVELGILTQILKCTITT